MALILNIETSSKTCSVALCDGDKTLGNIVSTGENDHSANLTVFIDKIMKEAGKDYNALDAISVSKGPGSYTGLRIGVSAAKGICFGVQKPLIGICTLEIMAYGILQNKEAQTIIEKNKQTLLCPMIDARRMEVYTALYDIHKNKKTEIKAEILTEVSYADKLEKSPIIFFGNGAEKFTKSISHPNAFFVSGIEPSAKFMSQLSINYFDQNLFENLAYFEPFYLKDFVTTTPKKVF